MGRLINYHILVGMEPGGWTLEAEGSLHYSLCKKPLVSWRQQDPLSPLFFPVLLFFPLSFLASQATDRSS